MEDEHGVVGTFVDLRVFNRTKGLSYILERYRQRTMTDVNEKPYVVDVDVVVGEARLFCNGSNRPSAACKISDMMVRDSNKWLSANLAY
jgi:hypothetical protein